jgi:hypothetical protein
MILSSPCRNACAVVRYSANQRERKMDSERTEGEVRRLFRKRQFIHLAIQGCVIPVMVVVFIILIGFTRRLSANFLSPGIYWIFLLVMAILGVLVLILYFRNWRCPKCGAYLGGASNPKRCPGCGVQLRCQREAK